MKVDSEAAHSPDQVVVDEDAAETDAEHSHEAETEAAFGYPLTPLTQDPSLNFAGISCKPR